MTIDEALKRMKADQTLSSVTMGWFAQDKTSLIYWLLEDPGDADYRVGVLRDILAAKDWKIDQK